MRGRLLVLAVAAAVAVAGAVHAPRSHAPRVVAEQNASHVEPDVANHTGGWWDWK